ncbi:MAG TPA: MGMT family protein [Acidimicrobiales bacterium]
MAARRKNQAGNHKPTEHRHTGSVPRRPHDDPLPPHAAPWPDDHRPTEFQQAVIDAVSELRAGELVSYGELAEELGRPGGGQAVANVLRRAPGLPWWRVVPAEGRLYRTHAPTQGPLLEAEGHHIDEHRRVHPRVG